MRWDRRDELNFFFCMFFSIFAFSSAQTRRERKWDYDTCSNEKLKNETTSRRCRREKKKSTISNCEEPEHWTQRKKLKLFSQFMHLRCLTSKKIIQHLVSMIWDILSNSATSLDHSVITHLLNESRFSSTRFLIN